MVYLTTERSSCQIHNARAPACNKSIGAIAQPQLCLGLETVMPAAGSNGTAGGWPDQPSDQDCLNMLYNTC